MTSNIPIEPAKKTALQATREFFVGNTKFKNPMPKAKTKLGKAGYAVVGAGALLTYGGYRAAKNIMDREKQEEERAAEIRRARDGWETAAQRVR